MIINELDGHVAKKFDIAIVAVGYEKRCTHVSITHNVEADLFLALEFDFLREGAFQENRAFFESKKHVFFSGTGKINGSPSDRIIVEVRKHCDRMSEIDVFLDVSSMSREMMSNVAIALDELSVTFNINVSTAYAPSKFTTEIGSLPIDYEGPINSLLAGWSSNPEKPLGAIFGMGCEKNLVLGALQFLEPDKTWLFRAKGIESKFDEFVRTANEHIADIFDATYFEYDICSPTITRGRFEALINSLGHQYRLITVPFGPKIFSWLSMATIVFTGRTDIGLWTFSSREKAKIVNGEAEGTVIWHNMQLNRGLLNSTSDSKGLKISASTSA